MRAHRNDVYRARRSRGKAWPVILWILAGLIVLAVILFFAGQKYIVYDSDGSLHVVFPIMETAAPSPRAASPRRSTPSSCSRTRTIPASSPTRARASPSCAGGI